MRKILSAITLAAASFAFASAADIPRPAPELSIAMPGNRVVRVNDYKDKVRIVLFILTT